MAIKAYFTGINGIGSMIGFSGDSADLNIPAVSAIYAYFEDGQPLLTGEAQSAMLSLAFTALGANDTISTLQERLQGNAEDALFDNRPDLIGQAVTYVWL